MYLDEPNEKQWVVDIETDSLTPTVIWVLCAENVKTGESVTLISYNKIKEWLDERVKEGCVFIGHNALKFDIPVLNALARSLIPLSRIVDTMLLSMVYSPSLNGGHSLEAWGKRLGCEKLEFNDFSRLTKTMIRYCKMDVTVCKKLFIKLTALMRSIGFSEEGLEIEHKAWWLIRKQQINGFSFNIDECRKLYALIRSKENELKDKIHEYWPPRLVEVKVYAKSHKQDGTETTGYRKHTLEYPKLELTDDGGYRAFDYVEFNIGSPSQRIEKLLELGWKPREFTKKTAKGGGGNPKVTDKGELVPSLVEFIENGDKEEVKLIANWITLNARANMLNTWMEAYNDKSGAIHGNLWLANTLRYRHSDPNTANIPAVRLDKDDKPRLGIDGYYTYEARDLWTVRDLSTRRLVGVDAKGIQLRVLAHYLNNAEFTEAVLAGDPHSYNQKIGGFATRPIAKTFIYAFLLGAGDEKVGQIIGGTQKDGKEVKSRFINNFPGLDRLLDDLERQIKRSGRIRLCDDTPIIVTKPHTRLGYLLQGDESRIMKKAAILSDQDIRRKKLDVLKVGDIHDEWQNDTFKDHVEQLRFEVFPEAFKQSGEFFRYRLPIECDTKEGLTWAETH